MFAAREAMESRVLNFLVYEYVNFLADVLELTDPEFDRVQQLFESENLKKYRLFTAKFSDQSLLPERMEVINRETDAEMRKFLSAQQWRDYLGLTKSLQHIG